MNSEFEYTFPMVAEAFVCPKEPLSALIATGFFNCFLVTILIAPVNAFCPKTLAAGPFMISIRSITSIGKAAFKE